MPAPQALSPLDAVAELKPLIEQHADEADQQRHLSDEVIEGRKEAGLFQMWLPQTVGGHETPLPKSLHVFEALARIDGSTGWIVAIASGIGMIGAAASEEVFHEQFGGENVGIVAVAGFPFQPAERVEGGYVITARWPYASGSHHARWLAGGAIVMRDGQPVMTPSGARDIRLMSFRREDAEILDTWRVTGLRGTGSSDIVVKDLFIPEQNSFAVASGEPLNASFQGPLYRLPMAARSSMPIGSIALGIAQHAVDAFVQLAATKVPMLTEITLGQRPTTHATFGAAVAALRAARAWYYDVADRIWEIALASEEVSTELRIDAVLAGAHATKTAASVVDDVQLLAGGTAIYETSPLERCFRDIHAVTQHMGTSHRNLEYAGGVLLGQPPANPMILS